MREEKKFVVTIRVSELAEGLGVIMYTAKEMEELISRTMSPAFEVEVKDADESTKRTED